jgi:hypothetical protein
MGVDEVLFGLSQRSLDDVGVQESLHGLTFGSFQGVEEVLLVSFMEILRIWMLKKCCMVLSMEIFRACMGLPMEVFRVCMVLPVEV